MSSQHSSRIRYIKFYSPKDKGFKRIAINTFEDVVNEYIDDVSHRVASDRMYEFARELTHYLNRDLSTFIDIIPNYMDLSSKPSDGLFSSYSWFNLAPSTIRRKNGPGGTNPRFWFSNENRDWDGVKTTRTDEPLIEYIQNGGITFKPGRGFLAQWNEDEDEGLGYLTIKTPFSSRSSSGSFDSEYDEDEEEEDSVDAMRDMFAFTGDEAYIQQMKIFGHPSTTSGASNEERRPLFHPIAQWFFGAHLRDNIDKFTKKRKWRIRVRLSEFE